MGNKASKKLAKGRLDKYYYLSKDLGYRSRAAFKLIQLDKKFDFLKTAKTAIIDLCAAPGGWTLVSRKQAPAPVKVIGIDLFAIKPIKGAITFQSDITTAECRNLLRMELKGEKADVVLHDGAPNVGSAWDQDAFEQSTLTLKSLALAVEFLRERGTFVTKVFRSKDYFALIWVFNQLFEKVHATKPASSRDVSAEIFVVCQGYKAPKNLDPKFLDPKHVFSELNANELDFRFDITRKKFSEREKKAALGYTEATLQALTRKTLVSTFIMSADPAAVLSNTAELVFDFEKGPLDKQIYNHFRTTDEVKEAIKDLRRLTYAEFKQLLKWRERVRTYLDKEAETNLELASLMERASVLKAKDSFNEANAAFLTGDEKRISMLEEKMDAIVNTSSGAKNQEVEVIELAHDDGMIPGEDSGLTLDEKENLQLQKQLQEVYQRELAEQKRKAKKEKNTMLKLKKRLALKIDGPSSNLVSTTEETGTIFSLQKMKKASQVNAVLDAQTDLFIEDASLRAHMTSLDKPDTEDPMFFDNYPEHRMKKPAPAYYLSDEEEGDHQHASVDAAAGKLSKVSMTAEEYLASQSNLLKPRTDARLNRFVKESDVHYEMDKLYADPVEGPKLKLAELKYQQQKDKIHRELLNESSSDDEEEKIRRLDPKLLLAENRENLSEKNPLLVKPVHHYSSSEKKAALWFGSGEFSGVIDDRDEGLQVERYASKSNLSIMSKNAAPSLSEKRKLATAANAAADGQEPTTSAKKHKVLPSKTKTAVMAHAISDVDEDDDDDEAFGNTGQLNKYDSAFANRSKKRAADPSHLRTANVSISSSSTTRTATNFADGHGRSTGYGGFAHDSEIIVTSHLEESARKGSDIESDSSDSSDDNAEDANDEIDINDDQALSKKIIKEKVIDDGTVDHILDAEGLAIGSLLVNKKSRHDLVNESYNRHAFGDELESIPKWFGADESKAYVKPIKLSKELVAYYKAKEDQLNKKTIKKVAEAKARKKYRLMKNMKQASAKADAVLQADTNALTKVKEIAKIYGRVQKKRTGSTYVINRKGGSTKAHSGAKGGRVVAVDKRMKKEKRALKRVAKANKKKN